MSRWLKRHLLLVCIGGPIVLLMLFTRSVPAQSAPVSPDHPWHTSTGLRIEADAKKIPDLKFNIDSIKTYALAELIDLAEAHNPATRVDWERARAQADCPPAGLFWQSLLRPGNPGFPGRDESQLHRL